MRSLAARSCSLPDRGGSRGASSAAQLRRNSDSERGNQNDEPESQNDSGVSGAQPISNMAMPARLATIVHFPHVRSAGTDTASLWSSHAFSLGEVGQGRGPSVH